MEYATIKTVDFDRCKTVTFNRPEHRNSISEQLLRDINQALDDAERDPSCRVIVLQGQDGIFCTGMDFQEAVQFDPNREGEGNLLSRLYMETIKRFATTSKIIIANVDGAVIAGGIGIVAASDLVVATPRSEFSLSEAIWGLLPAMVIPYLIRRVGYQTAYKMTLTTMPISAQRAYEVNLADEVTDSPDRWIRQLQQRLGRLSPATVLNMKQYFRKMWLITDEMEQVAVSEISRLVTLPEVKDNIENFLKFKKFPWEK
jgi:polyketide biosynthesis enoyl-CoA hydratase PksH